jgi:hypothetical protein
MIFEFGARASVYDFGVRQNPVLLTTLYLAFCGEAGKITTWIIALGVLYFWVPIGRDISLFGEIGSTFTALNIFPLSLSNAPNIF